VALLGAADAVEFGQVFDTDGDVTHGLFLEGTQMNTDGHRYPYFFLFCVILRSSKTKYISDLPLFSFIFFPVQKSASVEDDAHLRLAFLSASFLSV
jgi:hypothetical protein